MDFLGIRNNRFVKHKEYRNLDEDIVFREELVLTLDAVSQISVPMSQNFKLISTIKNSQRTNKQNL
ncbi:unnamed protein product [Paramecium sonneborni]|uniref:Uncharacterized protein n=1 Tax=Paramecium sonneborni TaxID=65129 RepID=A0A8S1RA98_9CILI|nr:unnamed protein product [Paramecium sonneborni]